MGELYWVWSTVQLAICALPCWLCMPERPRAPWPARGPSLAPAALTCCLLDPAVRMSALQWQAAIDYVHSAPVEDVRADFDGLDATVLNILQRYQVGARPWMPQLSTPARQFILQRRPKHRAPGCWAWAPGARLRRSPAVALRVSERAAGAAYFCLCRTPRRGQPTASGRRWATC